MYACLAVTCHLHFWQNDRDFLRATVVTRGWNGYRNKSQHRKSTLEKKILPPFQQGFEPATFQSRVRCSNHWAIPAPRGLGLGQFLPLTVFSLSAPFVSRVISFIYDVRVRGGSLVSVCCPAVLLSLLSGLYRVHGLRVSGLCHVARWHFLPPLSFQKVFVVVVVVLFSLSSLLTIRLSFLSLAYWPVRNCC